MRVLVSGGTGFLGSEVTPLLSQRAQVTLLSRTRPNGLKADLSLWDAGLDPKSLRGQFDIFLHMAGLYDLRASKSELFTQNIAGTHTALTIAQKAEIPHFVHISTVAVTMNEGHGGTWPDAYAESKAHAEKLVRSWSAESLQSRLILRLGVLVGNTRDGHIHRIDGPYHAPERLRELTSFLKNYPGPIPVPGRRHQPLPLVPVDVAAKAIVEMLRLSHGAQSQGVKSYYICSDQGPTAEELFRSTLHYLGIERDLQVLSSLPDWLTREAAEWITKLPREELSYLLGFPKFDLKSTVELLGPSWCPGFKEYEKTFWIGYETFISNR